MILIYLLAALVAYLIGSLSFAIIVSKFYNMSDPRSYGSKNAGATNVMRSGNKRAAMFTLLGDLLKGVIVVWGAQLLFRHHDGYQFVVALCGIFVVIGHIYPIFFKFKGGKGVATALGAMLGYNIFLALFVVATWFLVFKLSKISSLSALAVAVLAPVFAYSLMGNNAYFGATLVIAFFILYTHKSNIFRLITNQEHKFDKPKD
jgi:glycerol-3-phosphate acyltransferase PlsY